MAHKPSGTCLGIRTTTSDSDDYDCGYAHPPGACEDCIFGPSPTRNSIDPRIQPEPQDEEEIDADDEDDYRACTDASARLEKTIHSIIGSTDDGEEPGGVE